MQQEIQFWKRKIKRREFHEAHALAMEKREFEVVELLEPRCECWRSSILAAIKIGDLEMVIRYMNKIPEPDIARFCRQELVQWAAWMGHKHIIEYFMGLGEQFRGWIEPPAARGGHMHLLTMFPGIVNSRDCVKRACEGGHKNVVDFLLARGIEADSDILFHAALGGNKDIIDFFIAKGHQNWNLGLKGAALANHTHLVDFFIKAGATNLEELDRIKEWREKRAKFMWDYCRKKPPN